MKDEIKETLNRFASLKEASDRASYYPEDLLTREDMWILYDYITNLQQENERLKGSISAMKHNYNLLTTLIENGESMTQKFENGLTQKDYKSRVEKAIKYLNDKNIYDSEYGEFIYYQYLIHDNLIEILNGKGEE